MSEIEIALCKIINEIREMSGMQELHSICRSDDLQSDLGLDSLQLAELTVMAEAKYGVDVFEDGLVQTVGEVVDKILRFEDRC